MAGEELNIDDFFNGQTKNLKAVNEQLGLVVKQLSELKKLSSKTAESTNKFANSLVVTGNEMKKVNATVNEHSKIISTIETQRKEERRLLQAIAKEEVKRSSSIEKLNKKLEENKIRNKRANDEMKRAAKINATAAGSYDRLQAELSDNIAKYKQLTAAERANIAVGGKMVGNIKRQQGALKSMDATLGNHQRNVGNYRSALGGVGSSLKTLAGAYLGFAGIRQFGRFLSSSLEAYDKQVTSVRQLTAALGDNEDASKRIQVLAAELQGKTIYGDEDTITAARQLAAAGLQNERQMKALLPLIQDIAALEGINLTKATKKVTTAIATGSTTLEKYGVELSSTASLTENADKAIQGLTESVGGQAEVLASAGTGELKQFSNTWGDFKESVGGALNEVLKASGIIEQTNDSLSAMNSMLSNDSIPAWDKFFSVFNAGILATTLANDKLIRSQDQQMQKLKELTTDVLVKTNDEVEAFNAALGVTADKIGETVLVGDKMVVFTAEMAKNIAFATVDEAKFNLALKEVSNSLEENTKKTETNTNKLKERNEELLRGVSITKTIEQQNEEQKKEALALRDAIFETTDATKNLTTELDNVSKVDVSGSGEGSEMSMFEQITGVTDSEEFKTTLNDTLGAAINFIETIAAERTRAAEEEVQQRETNIQSLEKEIESAEANNEKRTSQGLATSNKLIEQKKKELSAEKRALAEAEKERKKAARSEQLIQIGQAIGNTALGVTKALTLPFPLSAVIAALIATQGLLQVATIKRQKFRKGGQWVEDGNLHSEGGNAHGNKEFERGEQVTVLSRKNTRKYGGFMNNIESSIRKGTLERDFSSGTIINAFDTSSLENEVKGLRKDNRKLLKHLEQKPISETKDKKIYIDKTIYYN